MSRAGAEAQGPGTRFPRVSGDEPALRVIADELDTFSPRERG